MKHPHRQYIPCRWHVRNFQAILKTQKQTLAHAHTPGTCRSLRCQTYNPDTQLCNPTDVPRCSHCLYDAPAPSDLLEAEPDTNNQPVKKDPTP